MPRPRLAGEPRGHLARAVGWLLAANAIGVLIALVLAGTASDTVQRLALLCGIG